jgi:hypothetical protein
MKKYFIYATMALFFATFVGCNEKNEEPRPNDPTTKSYDVSYKLNIATGKASDEGRKKIIDMVNSNLQPLGMSLAQMSESVWGASIPFGNDSVAARSFYNDLNSTLIVPYSQINVDNGILFYGYIEEIKKVDGDNHNYYNSHSEYITSPRPNKYRYVINRKTWDVKWFELPENANLDSFTDREITIVNGKSVDIELGDLSCLDYRIEVSPAYCSITLNRDGKLTVKAMGRYKGDDELKFTVSDRMGTIKTITVKINITE